MAPTAHAKRADLEVAPHEAQRLALAQAKGQRDRIESLEPIAARSVKETPSLLRR